MYLGMGSKVEANISDSSGDFQSWYFKCFSTQAKYYQIFFEIDKHLEGQKIIWKLTCILRTLFPTG